MKLDPPPNPPPPLFYSHEVDVARLKIESDEVLIIRFDGQLTQTQAEYVKEMFTRAFEKANGAVPSILVVEGSFSFVVMKAADAALMKGSG